MTVEQFDMLRRIEQKLDILIAALGEDDEEPAARTLDGELAGGERDENTPL